MTRRARSHGARQLAAKGSQAELAEKVGVTQQAISGWLTGRCLPNSRHLLRIEKIYRIDIADWFRTNRVRSAGAGDAAAGPEIRTG